MTIVVDSDDLKTVIGKVIKDIDQKSTMRVLSGVLFRTSGDDLEIIGTDITTTARYRILASFEEDAQAVVDSPGKLIKWLKARKDNEEVEIDLNEMRAVFKRAGRTLTLGVLTPDDFPSVEFEEKWNNVLHIEAGALATWGAFILQTADDDEYRPYLFGASFMQGQIFSTDGHRANIFECREVSTKKRFIVPTPAWKRIVQEAKACLVADDVIIFEKTIRKDEKDPTPEFLRVTFADHERVIRLPVTHVPNINDVIPKHNETIFVPDVSEFEQAIKEVASVATKEERIVYLIPEEDGVKIDFTNKEDNVSLEIVVPGVWTIEKELIEKLRPGFNYRYLKDALSCYEKPILKFGTDPLDAVMIVQDDYSLSSIVMPIRPVSCNK